MALVHVRVACTSKHALTNCTSSLPYAGSWRPTKISIDNSEGGRVPAKRELVRPAALCGLAYARTHHARTGGPAESTLAQGRYLTATGRQSCTRDRINCPPQACQRQRQRCRPRAREVGLRDLGPATSASAGTLQRICWMGPAAAPRLITVQRRVAVPRWRARRKVESFICFWRAGGRQAGGPENAWENHATARGQLSIIPSHSICARCNARVRTGVRALGYLDVVVRKAREEGGEGGGLGLCCASPARSSGTGEERRRLGAEGVLR